VGRHAHAVYLPSACRCACCAQESFQRHKLFKYWLQAALLALLPPDSAGPVQDTSMTCPRCCPAVFPRGRADCARRLPRRARDGAARLREMAGDCARWREIARDGGRLREIRCTSSRASRPRRCTGSCAARGTRCGVCIPGPYLLPPSSRWTKADTPVVAMGEAAGPLPPPCCLCAGPKLRHICIPTTPREETHSAASRRIPLPSLYS